MDGLPLEFTRGASLAVTVGLAIEVELELVRVNNDEVLQDVVDRSLPMAPPPMPAGMSGDPNTPPVNTPRPTGETRELEVPPDARPPGP